ncbi:MAG: Ig-like domain-containing protein [Halobacteriota archaeon]|jgi:hypothetical protein
MIKKLLAITVLVVVASLSIAGCASPTSSNQAVSSTPSASARPSATQSPSPTATPTPSIVPFPSNTPSPLPTPTQTPTPVQATAISFAMPPLRFYVGETMGSEIALQTTNPIGPVTGATVNLYLNGVYVGQTTTQQGFGSATWGTASSVGNVTLTASFAGNSQYGPSSVSATFQVVTPQQYRS